MARRDTRSYADRREYLIAAVSKRRKKIRQMAIKYKGGACENCGYNRCTEALEFHHADSSGKDFGVSDKGYTRNWTKVKRELDKCILLCANCHRELHAKLAASGGDTRVKSRLSQGTRNVKSTAILSYSDVTSEECRDYTPATLTSSRG